MNTNKAIVTVLRAGIIVGLILIVIGECISGDNAFLYWGMLILISSPFLAVIAAFVGLISEKDRFWACIAGIVVLIMVSGAVVAML